MLFIDPKSPPRELVSSVKQYGILNSFQIATLADPSFVFCILNLSNKNVNTHKMEYANSCMILTSASL